MICDNCKKEHDTAEFCFSCKEELEQEIKELEEEKEQLENNENEDEYNDMLDDVTGEIRIGSLTYSASQVLKSVDEIAYNVGLNEFNDNKISEIETEIDDKKKELEK
tara:strand:+ start:939 stop:1259 length:321 start_codon:yes stop_codon:yes gene_type:complete